MGIEPFDIAKAGKKVPTESKFGKSLKGKAAVNEHEKELADKLGGRRQPLSGALEAHKGDIKTEHFLFDSKETVHNSIIVQGADLVKITREARGEGKHPALVLTIGTMPATVEKEWVALPLTIFAEIMSKFASLP